VLRLLAASRHIRIRLREITPHRGPNALHLALDVFSVSGTTERRAAFVSVKVGMSVGSLAMTGCLRYVRRSVFGAAFLTLARHMHDGGLE